MTRFFITLRAARVFPRPYKTFLKAARRAKRLNKRCGQSNRYRVVKVTQKPKA